MDSIKFMDNDDLDDGDRRATSANVDGYLSMISKGIDLMVVEVSRAPLVSDYTHFLNDRTKIALSLKKMFQYLIQKNPMGFKSVLSNIKLYGVQFYRKST